MRNRRETLIRFLRLRLPERFMDGAALAPKQGPLRVVAPHEKRPARWVRMLKRLR